MQDDDLVPNDGTYFLPREPVEQAVARKKERAQALEALTVIEGLIKHFDERIEFRDRLDSINPLVDKDPLAHKNACTVNALLKLALIEEKGLLLELLEVHAPSR